MEGIRRERRRILGYYLNRPALGRGDTHTHTHTHAIHTLNTHSLTHSQSDLRYLFYYDSSSTHFPIAVCSTAPPPPPKNWRGRHQCAASMFAPIKTAAWMPRNANPLGNLPPSWHGHESSPTSFSDPFFLLPRLSAPSAPRIFPFILILILSDSLAQPPPPSPIINSFPLLWVFHLEVHKEYTPELYIHIPNIYMYSPP